MGSFGNYGFEDLQSAGFSTPGEFYLEIAKGNISGHSFVHKFGENPLIPSAGGFADIWDVGGKYDHLSVERIHDLSSSSALDVGAVVSSGTATGGSVNTVVDTAALFQTDGVSAGDFVLNDTALTLGEVLSVPSETTLNIKLQSRFPSSGLLAPNSSQSGDSYRVVTNSSTGASILWVVGLDGNYVKQEEFLVLNGLTNVPTSLSWFRPFRARVFGPGTSANVGDLLLTAQVDGNVSLGVQPGFNQTLMAIYTIPVGKVGYLVNWWGSLSRKQDSTSNIRLRGSLFPPISHVLESRSVDNTGSSSFIQDFLVPKILPQASDVLVEGDSTNTTGVSLSAGFQLILVEE